MAAHSSILAWEVSWTEEPGGLQSTGSQSVKHDLATKQHRMAYPTVTLYFRWLLCFLLTVICWLYPVSQVLWEALRNRGMRLAGGSPSAQWSGFRIPWEQFCDRVLLVSRWSEYFFFFFFSVWNIKTFLGFYKNALSYLLNLKVSSFQLSTLIIKEGTLLIKTEKSYCS